MTQIVRFIRTAVVRGHQMPSLCYTKTLLMDAQFWIDNSLIVVSLLLAIVTLRSLKHRAVGAIAAFFFLFPPILVFLNMWGHTVAVSITAYKRYAKGTFQYSFHFYGLLLMGLVGIVVSGLIIHYSKKLAQGHRRYKSTVYTLHLIIAALFIPVGFINPLGFMPTLAAILSSVAIALSARRRPRTTTTPAYISETAELPA